MSLSSTSPKKRKSESDTAILMLQDTGMITPGA